MEFKTLHSINPNNYNNLFSTSYHKNKKIYFRNIFSKENNRKRYNSIYLISQNQVQDNKDYNSHFLFNKTDLVPIPKFPKIKKIHKFNKKKLLAPAPNNKKKNIFSIKYLELIKDINNEKELKRYYFINKNKKIKDLNENENGEDKIVKIILDTDINTLKNNINELDKIKYKINDNYNPINLIKKINNENKEYSHNIFLKEILNNINRKIEIYSKENNQIDIIFVKNLLINELNKLAKYFNRIKKNIKFLIKENIIKKNIYNNDPSKIFNLSSSSFSSSDENNKNIFNQKYFQIIIKNSNKNSKYAKNFKNEFESIPSSQRKKNNLSLTQTVITSNYKDQNNNTNYNPIITIYNFKKRNCLNKENKNKNENKASELIKEISNKIEKKYGKNQNNIQKNNIISQDHNINDSLNKSKELVEDKNINTEIQQNNNNSKLFKKNKSLFINSPKNKNKYFKPNIHINKILSHPINIHNNYEKKYFSPIKKDRFKEEEKRIKTINKRNVFNHSIIKDKETEKIDKEIKTKEEPKIETNYSILKLFEQIKNNEILKKKKEQILNDKNEKNDKEEKISKNIPQIEEKKSKAIENEIIKDNKEEIKIDNSLNNNNYNINTKVKKKVNIAPILISNKKLLEEVNIIRKEILQPKNSLVQKKNKKNKSKIINKKELKDIKNKISIIHNIHEMNFNEEEKEFFLKNIFNYKMLLYKNPKTPEEIEREEELKEKLRIIIEKYIYELQIKELVNVKSIFSRKKSLKKRINFLKNLNILEEEKFQEIEEKIKNIKNNNEENIQKEANLKMIRNNNVKEISNTKRRLKFQKSTKKLKLIYDNSYLFKKPKKKKEIKDEVKKILEQDYSTTTINNNSMNNSINETESFYSFNSKKQLSKIKKNKNISRKSSIFSYNGDNFKSKFMEKINKEDMLRKEEELKRKRKLIEEQKKKEERFNKRLYSFFEKIRKMKNNDEGYQDELEKLIDERIVNNIDNIKEIRINDFIKKLELNREKEKFYVKFKNKRYGYTSPLVFTMNNFYPKDKNIFEDNIMGNMDEEKKYNKTVYNYKNE